MQQQHLQHRAPLQPLQRDTPPHTHPQQSHVLWQEGREVWQQEGGGGEEEDILEEDILSHPQVLIWYQYLYVGAAAAEAGVM